VLPERAAGSDGGWAAAVGTAVGGVPEIMVERKLDTVSPRIGLQLADRRVQILVGPRPGATDGSSGARAGRAQFSSTPA